MFKNVNNVGPKNESWFSGVNIFKDKRPT